VGYPEKKPGGGFCYRDYLLWPEGERWELIEGLAYNLTPSPSRRHQEVSVALASQFFNYLKSGECKVYAAPFDVRLADSEERDEEIKTVVQPDIVIVCDLSKLDEKGCRGAPDLVVEIVSPTTAALDYKDKLLLYEKHGVKEYWIIHPVDHIVTVYTLQDNLQYGKPVVYSKEEEINSTILPSMIINLAEIFETGE
jgi:Uma2 family endonuclease